MGDTEGSFAPLPGAPMFFKAPEAEPPTRPMSTEYGFARRMEELFQPLGPKRAKHTFSALELAAIDSKPVEAYLAKPPRVKAWNAKKARLLNIPNLKIELKQETQQVGGSDTQQRWSQECVTVSFCVAADKTLSQVLSMELTSNQIKTHMFELAGIQAKVEDYDLRIPAINHVVSLDNLALRRQTFIQACLLSRISPLFEVVPKSTTNTSDDENLKKHIQTELEIFELVGLPLARTLDLYKPEVIASRRALAALRLGVTRNHHTSSDAELQQFVYVESEPLPLTIPSNVSVVAQLPINAIRITVSVDPTKEVDEARNKIFRKFSIIDKANSQGKSANDYVLKATGFREYLVPSLNLANNNRHQLSSSNKNERFKLIDYDFIRKRISKNQQIELTLVDVADLREQIAEAEGESIIDHLLCAEFESEQAQAQQVTSGKIETNFEDSYDPPFPSLLNTRPIPATKMHRSFRIKACCVRDTRTAREDVFTKFKEKEKGDPSIYVKMELFHGGQSLAPAILTPLAPAPVSEKDAPLVYPQWDEWREFPIKISDLPKATVVSFTIYAGDSDLGWTASSDIKGVPLGWGNIQLVDYDGCIRMGLFARKLWEDGVANPIGTCMDNVKKGAATLLVEFETFIRPLVYSDPLIPTPAAPIAASALPINTNSPGSSPPTSPVQTHRNMYDLASIRKSSYNLSSSQLGLTPFRKIETAEARQLQSILQYDPLTPLTPSDKKMMWNFRNLTRPKYRALPKFLQSVAWGDSEQVAETHRLLEVWAVPPPVLALQLLDAKFPDETVRNYAVTILNSLTDAEVSDFLPQLVQVLKYELHHDSPLARLLIERALRNRSRIGHSFFWFLRAEMHVSEIEERYGILLEGYLRSCGRHRTELLKQHQVLKDLYSVAMAVKNAAPTDRKKALMDGLSQVKFPERFQLPLDPRWEVKGLIQDKCRFMDSKKLPLWLTFENVEPNAPPINVIFKVGDDIRQDILTLQMIRIMDKMWKNASMDLRLNPYGTVSMGDSIGMIEVVLNSKTIASINKDAGGTGAVLADKSLDNWLRKHNPSEALYSQAVKTFILSCAGYVVATYVLGIGDRHADNIMMSRSGHLFHIDFGHFLGNFKSKFGFKRERAPFIFTAQYLAIVGGKDSENFKYFVDVCCKAYNIIRKQSDLFMNLFQLMVSTGIPELQSIDDINYLRKTLAPELSDDDAASEFSKNILVALNTKTVIINDIIHGWVH